jgi:hypothetical protein
MVCNSNSWSKSSGEEEEEGGRGGEVAGRGGGGGVLLMVERKVKTFSTSIRRNDQQVLLGTACQIEHFGSSVSIIISISIDNRN